MGMFDVWFTDQRQPFGIVMDVVPDHRRIWILEVSPNIFVVENQINSSEGKF